MSSNIFYVYIIFDPRKPNYSNGDLSFNFEPFYIGKGKGARIKQSLLNNHFNPYKQHKIDKINSISEVIVEKYKENLTNEEACLLEKELIRKIGRYDLGLGPLTNLTDGGDGIGGYKQSQEHIQKRLKSVIGRKTTKEENIPRSKWHTGRTTAKDLNGNIFYAESNDSRWLTGEIVGVAKGIKRGPLSEAQKIAISESNKRRANKKNV